MEHRGTVTNGHAVELNSIETVISRLNEAQVRYLIAGGIAVIAHGVMRLTFDLDLVIALDRDNVLAAVGVLGDLGYSPNVPVQAEELADEETRQRWIRDKHMMVFQMVCGTPGFPPVDIFVEEPFDVAAELARSLAIEISDGVPAYVISLPTLLKMKEQANRPNDLEDIRRLTAIHGKLEDESD